MHYFFNLLLSKAALFNMTVCTIETYAFHFPKVWSTTTTYLRSFQYLKITLLLHGSLHSRIRSAGCVTTLAACEGKCHYIDMYRAESVNVVRL